MEGENLDVREIANPYSAARLAAKEGIEWLVSIDADELILMSRDGEEIEQHIPRHLEKFPKMGIVEQIRAASKLQTKSSPIEA